MESHEAAERFVAWLNDRVTAEGRGDGRTVLDANPAGVFWLGRLAPETDAAKSVKRERRMDPCAIGMRARPMADSAWSFTATIKAVAWNQFGDDKWQKTDGIQISVPVDVRPGDENRAFGGTAVADAFDAVGAPGVVAELRVTDESWRGTPELVIELVNVTPDDVRKRGERHLFEVELEITGLQAVPFELESLPDSFRYDRRLPAIGINCGVALRPGGKLVTTDTVVVDRKRPEYNFGGTDPAVLDLTFEALASDPVARLTDLLQAYQAWGEDHWSDAQLARRARDEGWQPGMVAQARQAAGDYRDELDRLNRGLAALKRDKRLRYAFSLMNLAMARASRAKYNQWRPFQIGFVLSVLPSFVKAGTDWNHVETVWFTTGGGKTETYLALLVLAAFYDRLRGKRSGITAWSRFPLRMLSLQQTQRFADALGAAELIRRDHKVAGAPISLGYFVGANATPNAIPIEPTDFNPIDVEDDAMPARYLILTSCPFCGTKGVYTKFDRRNWTLRHLCRDGDCPSDGEPLPFYIVDQEIYRFLPTVVIGTLDKASLIAMQANMRGFLEGPAGKCTRSMHGYTYALRSTRPNGCLVPGCKADVERIKDGERPDFAPSFRLQDELHLLRDSLGAVDSHYESLMDSLQEQLTGTRPKIIASSATLTGYNRQVDVLYQRPGRVFPVPGPSARESFWSRETDHLLRRFVAVWPRGVTLEWVNDRTLTILQQSVRRLREQPEEVCAEVGVDSKFSDFLLDLYGTDVIYGNTVRDVEAALRSTGTQVPVAPLNVVSLTGQTQFEQVREALERLEQPEAEFDERIHVVTASSMMSHGVDVNRLNIMTVLGVPLTTAEFIQATARVGRAHPGLIYVIHKIGRERDATVFSHFEPFVQQGDRFVEPIPVTRSSRRVLELTTPAAIESRRLFVHEPKSSGKRLTTVDLLRRYFATIGVGAEEEARACAAALGIDEAKHLAFNDVMEQLEAYFARLEDTGFGARFPNELFDRDRRPMLSLRDVETQVPVSDD
ncbi:helicase [Actinomadura sp. GC306]|uniref:helicase C-terminal domain-containing protein n=1 Tax=Actinomadura sp. GC306 TaxID=2530367 RepID=UPI001052EDAF|nr:helicase C-terminal domain-containing protein [Actinomadura sp. GC306]TDC69855.1 helicase [Actinomadura sp. GC306]